MAKRQTKRIYSTNVGNPILLTNHPDMLNMLSTAETMDNYAARNNCSGYPDAYVETFVVGTSWCREYTGCDASVAYCELGFGHITYLTPELDVAAVFWNFFSRH